MVWYECLSECECSFEIDEEDCPTQPGGSEIRERRGEEEDRRREIRGGEERSG